MKEADKKMPLLLKYTAITVGVTVILAALLYAAYAKGLWRFNNPSPEDYPLQGLDVSHHQGDIDWGAVPKDRFGFVYMKATEGGDFKDRKFRNNWREARKNGFQVGAYHFFTLCRSGVQQSRNFIETVPKEKDSLAPVIDLEFVGNCSARPPEEKLRGDLRAYITSIQNHYEVKPMLYTTYGFYKRYLQKSEFESYPLWVRDIFNKPDENIFPDWVLWQYADNARIQGIEGPVDLNVKRK